MSKFLQVVCMALIIAGTFSSVTQAQQNGVFNLNTEASTEKNKAGSENFVFEVNKDVFAHPEFKAGAEFDFLVAPGESRRFTITKKTEYLPGYISILAVEEGESKQTFSATYGNGRLNGIYHPKTNSALKVSYAGDQQLHELKKASAEDHLACGVKGNHDLVAPGRLFEARNQGAKAKTSSSAIQPQAAPVNASIDDEITIDLMLVYTDAAEQWAATSEHGNISGVLTQAMNNAQEALDNSELNIELRLVHTHKTDYDEVNDDVDSNTLLRRFTQNPNNPIQFCNPDNEDCDVNEWDGYMEQVHDLRQEHGADVVALVAKIDDTGGLGWRLGSTGGNSQLAFNLNRVQQVASGYTLIHEIGHNMGNAHSRTQKSAKANDSGGLFHFSAGYQNESADFHTVMAYDTTSSGAVLPEIPFFSSPDLTWNGNPLGTNDNQTPENNALSMKQIKRTVAGYLPSVVDAPAAATSTDEITVTMNREDVTSASLTLSNSGASNLMWNVDFEIPGNTVGKQKTSNKNVAQMEPLMLETPVRQPANYSNPVMRTKSTSQEQVLYSTSFESGEGFNADSHLGIKEWRSLNNTSFEVSIDNPSSGSQHLRLESEGGNAIWSASPFLGYQLFGKYEVTIDFLISDNDETYDFYLRDGKTGQTTSGIIIGGSDSGNGLIYVYGTNENGAVSFWSTSTQVSENTYHTLRIFYNTDEGTVDYYLDGNSIGQYKYAEGQGYAPALIEILNRSEVSGSILDVDDIEIKRINAPYQWLSVSDNSGITEQGNNSQVALTFDTRGVEAGTYETTMTIATNDPNNPGFSIPVTLNVNDAVSNEPGNHPQKITLNQNYPNPFNPSTVISYQLSVSSEVQLEVFDMAGRKVATLVDGRQPSGNHRVQFDGSGLASGVYMYQLKSAQQTITRQMVLVK